ncbi:sulfide/dihydroorotate dehydrogenase-like FAD/NAD-binding protein [Clostridium sp. C8-1-8]|uniref:sulfide/dihydroorotate dehydrogenase-like FAD/NAD-binding protein n=1 Tax=Clostridium sp. C8-1-8 TaxID=2698831 RepID=UPI001368FF17|nr:sulfide/dihydroorotate dehydrogenase-like FAD/NAD-binding protein [Clostridium sp. C8-1-8]
MTEACPCHLAEAGECILCSQLHGKCFCDCLSWKGVCIYQEFSNNGNVAKKGRETFRCKVKEVAHLEGDVLLIRFIAPHKLALDLVHPGSYVFIRTDENFYFDVPISIMESDIETDLVSLMIEIRGIKTKKLLDIKIDDEMVIRGPYWNGVFGLKSINELKDSKALVIARGIGMAPAIPVIRKLSNNNNALKIIMDKSPYKEVYVDEYLAQYTDGYEEINTIDKGKLSDEIKKTIEEAIKNGVKLIHVAGADILSYKVIEYLDSINEKDVKVSCCNNAKMCCGEGVCGSCTARFQGHRVKRLCKVQTDPRNIFEGRRFI